MALDAENIYPLALYRKCLLTTDTVHMIQSLKAQSSVEKDGE